MANSSSWKELQQGIPVTNLGLTLQHAIQVYSWLNIEYIWIDSLCILQDSPADWEIEAAKIEMVYTIAIITIIASSTASSSSEFLHNQHNESELGSQLLRDIDLFLGHGPLFAQRESISGFHADDRETKTDPLKGHR